MKRRTATVSACALGALLCAFAAPALARQDADDATPPSLLVSGVGIVDVPADQIEVSFSIVTDGKTPEEALTANQTKVESVLRALKAIGFEGADVRTANFSIYPQYGQPQRDGAIAPQIVGYQVANSVNVKTKKMEAGGKIIQAAVNAGANRVESVSFGLSAPKGRDEAINAATAKARKDAATLAAAAGVKLGAVRRIRLDANDAGPQPYDRNVMYRMAEGAAGAPEPTLTPGAIPVRATVTIEYDIAAN